jgi:hypothetical protein
VVIERPLQHGGETCEMGRIPAPAAQITQRTVLVQPARASREMLYEATFGQGTLGIDEEEISGR